MTMIPDSGQERERWLRSLWPDRLIPSHALIRECFAIEVHNYINGIDSDYYENTHLSALYLYVIGDVKDSVAIYDAKFSDFDVGCSLDHQFMLGAGHQATLEHATSIGRIDMVQYLKGYGNHELKELPAWRAYRHSYFDLK